MSDLVEGKTYIIQKDGYNFSPDDIGKPLKFEGYSNLGHYKLGVSLVEGIKYNSMMFFKLCTVRETFGDEPIEYNPDPVGFEEESPLPASIDSHYDNWYTLTQDEIDLGKVKIDPYLYYGVNSIGDDDKFGCKMHMLKNLSRHKESNSQEREIVGLYKTIKRMAELNGIDLEDV
jgi:hypothetical protein